MRSLLLLPFRLLVKLPFRLILKLKLIVIAVLAGMGIAYGVRLRDDHRRWGLIGTDVARELPGDDLVADPRVVETRSLDIEAPPEAIWPWIVQMGHGRGGWYSYDTLIPQDGQGSRAPGADRILPQFQELAPGDTVPTHAGGGFEARIVEPGRTLVLYLDAAMVKRQLEVMAAEGEAAVEAALGDDGDGRPKSGDLPDIPDFTVSWAFVLEAEGAARTRLIVRFRGALDEQAMPSRLGLPFVGYGVFAVTRRQMLGIKERAERAAG